MEKELMHPDARFRINNIAYKITKAKPRKGDLVLDIRNCSFGIHDGKFKGFITVKDGHVVEGVPFEKVKKLIKA